MAPNTAALLAALALVALAAAAPPASADQAWTSLERHVPAHEPSTSSWRKGSRLPGEHPVTVTVVVRVDEERRADLERAFWEVSDPDSKGYGQHLSLDDITRLLAVPQERVERLVRYFLAAGAAEAKAAPSRDMISVTMPAAVAESCLRTRLHFFSHQEHGLVRIVRASSGYSLPSELAADVTMVGELLQFPRLRPSSLADLGRKGGRGSWPNACAALGCRGLVTPGVLAERYKLPKVNVARAGGAQGSMALAEFQGQFYKPSDLQAFSEGCHRNVTVDRVIGYNKPGAGVEAELDIEYIKSVAPAVPLTFIYNLQYSLLHWANQITSMDDPIYIHSVSYGNDEAQQTGAEYMYACNTAFMKAGARGMSILFASGDQGVCGREGCGIFRVKHFNPDFPAGSPYITAVGGTNFQGRDIGPETAWSGSGGGFSNTFPVPAYQQDAVAAYKSSPLAKLPPQQFWNATGRGYPDVAALGGTKTPYCVRTGGFFQGVAGTSASSPVVAGVFALLNSLRLAAGKPALGFLNPFIYKNPSGFQDVTSGMNNNGRRYGFTAIKGWDAATGFGTPDFEALSKLALASGSAKDELLVI